MDSKQLPLAAASSLCLAGVQVKNDRHSISLNFFSNSKTNNFNYYKVNKSI